jgi:general secretion pathway protein I
VARQGGFSLLEVVVAFAILALILGLLIQVFSRAITTTALSGDYSRAATLAEERLNAVGTEIPLEIGSYQGETDGGFAWRVDIDLYEPLDVSWEPTIDAFLVVALASWGGEPGRRIRLSTLRITDSADQPGLSSPEGGVTPPKPRRDGG